jgi:hypothetical protein
LSLDCRRGSAVEDGRARAVAGRIRDQVLHHHGPTDVNHSEAQQE